MYFKQLSQGLLFLSVAALFDKTVPVLGLKLDETFLILATITLFISLIRKEFTVDWKKIVPYFWLFIIIILTTVIGSLMSLHIFGTIPFHQIVTEYHILLGCFLIFFEILILGMNDTRFLTWLVYAFLFSVIVVITPYIHLDTLQHLIGAKQYRFFGLIGDANYFPTFMTLPIALVFYFLLKNIERKKILWGVLLYILFAILVGLVWWSGSRSGWLGIIASIIAVLWLFIRTKNKKVLYTITLSLLFISSVAMGYVLLPHNAKSDIRARLGYITTPEQQAAVNSPETLEPGLPAITNGDNSVKIIPIIDDVSYSQDRVHIWEQGMHYFAHDPLGYGLVYYNIINIVSAGYHVSAHSFIVETLLIGGPILFLILLYTVWAALYSFYKKQKIDRSFDIEGVVYAGLIGFLVCSLFLSSLELRWFWIELAILIAWQMNRPNYDPFLIFRKKATLESANQPLEK